MPDLPDPARIRAALSRVADPEIGADIVALGLVYRIAVETERVVVDMTLTSPACPMSQTIVDEARAVLADALPAGWTAAVRVVDEPPWEPAMMSAECRRRLGWPTDD